MDKVRSASIALGITVALAFGSSALADGASATNDQKLLAAGSPQDKEWVTFGRDLGGQRASPLAEINRDTVHALVPVWIYQLGGPGVTQGEPLVVDGAMYVSTATNDVAALNAATGEPIWRYTHAMQREAHDPRNRGLAIAYGMVFLASEDGRVIALDQRSGSVIWDKKISPFDARALVAPGDPAPSPVAFNFRWAPLAFGGQVIVGATRFEADAVDSAFLAAATAAGKDPGVEWIKSNLGRRGFVASLDAKSGTERWRWYTTREGDWTGQFSPTAPGGQPLDRDLPAEKALASRYALGWAAGSASVWQTPTVDPDLGLLFVTTGNPEPSGIDLMRPGDNLYSNSVVALDLQSGALRWYFQEVPHGIYDATSQNVLFTLATKDGPVPALVNCGKSGFCYALDRRSGKLLFESDAVVSQANMFSTGKLGGIVSAPGSGGGVGVSPLTFDAKTGLLYVEGIDRPETRVLTPVPGAEELSQDVIKPLPANKAHGTLTAIDLYRAGKKVWQVTTDQPLTGGALATAGGLVFIGESNGHFSAFDAANGARLWSFQTGTAISAPPISYEVGGQQFVAVESGAPGDGSRFGGAAVFVFALPSR